ncbi:MAG: fluoride efflux transporter CrcB [Vicinamibacterales bacterium]
MPIWVAVAVGGALGSVARHGVNHLVQGQARFARFPWATMLVNVSGCLIIGLLAGVIASGRLPMRAGWREFVFVGLLGGFTTFSTFGLDTVTLLRAGATGDAFLNVAGNLVIGVGAVYAGLLIGELGR